MGAMVIIRPGFQQVSLGQLAQLLASPIFAASYLMAKRLSFKESSLVIVGMLSLFVSMAQIPMVLVVWETPDLFDVTCLGLVAILATTGHYAMTQSFRLTPMTISQPVTYLQLVWASIMGIYLFGDRFDIFVILGGTMITLSATIIAYLDTRAPKDAI
jgi:drug/metabolite transporter (DMT)-like permease